MDEVSFILRLLLLTSIHNPIFRCDDDLVTIVHEDEVKEAEA
jgi:hypothetical protein